MKIPDSPALANGLAVTALGLFLCFLPFFGVPTSNQTLALAIVTGFLGFIGGRATAPTPPAEEETKEPPLP